MLPYKVIDNKRRPALIICNRDAGNMSYQRIMLADYESVIKEVAAQSEVDIIPLLVKVHPKGKTESNLLVPDDFPREKMPFHLAPRFRKPILIIAGDKDDRTPL